MHNFKSKISQFFWGESPSLSRPHLRGQGTPLPTSHPLVAFPLPEILDPPLDGSIKHILLSWISYVVWSEGLVLVLSHFTKKRRLCYSNSVRPSVALEQTAELIIKPFHHPVVPSLQFSHNENRCKSATRSPTTEAFKIKYRRDIKHDFLSLCGCQKVETQLLHGTIQRNDPGTINYSVKCTAIHTHTHTHTRNCTTKDSYCYIGPKAIYYWSTTYIP